MINKIYHIGSTAIPSIKAKPIIDMLASVKRKLCNVEKLCHLHVYGKGHENIKKHLDFVAALNKHAKTIQTSFGKKCRRYVGYIG